MEIEQEESSRRSSSSDRSSLSSQERLERRRKRKEEQRKRERQRSSSSSSSDSDYSRRGGALRTEDKPIGIRRRFVDERNGRGRSRDRSLSGRRYGADRAYSSRNRHSPRRRSYSPRRRRSYSPRRHDRDVRRRGIAPGGYENSGRWVNRRSRSRSGRRRGNSDRGIRRDFGRNDNRGRNRRSTSRSRERRMQHREGVNKRANALKQILRTERGPHPLDPFSGDDVFKVSRGGKSMADTEDSWKHDKFFEMPDDFGREKAKGEVTEDKWKNDKFVAE